MNENTQIAKQENKDNTMLMGIVRNINFKDDGGLDLSNIRIDMQTLQEKIMTKQGVVTQLGYKIIIATLCDTIIEISNSAAKQGLIRDRILNDALNRISKPIVDKHEKKKGKIIIPK